MGEHAVLHGYKAIVAAVSCRVHVEINCRNDHMLNIHSALGDLKAPMQNIVVEKPFTFVLSAIKYYEAGLKCGLDVIIKSEFSHQVGLGSSSAVTVAMVAALRKILKLDMDLSHIFHDAYEIVRSVQGVGSGADVAASVFGGVGCYRTSPFYYKKLNKTPRVFLYYSGSKMSTPDVIAFVKQKFSSKPQALEGIYKAINKCVISAELAIENADWRELGRIFNKQQKLMDDLGLTNEALQSLVELLSRQSKVKGVKISGSGLGDCVIALGTLKDESLMKSDRYIPIEITKEGVNISE